MPRLRYAVIIGLTIGFGIGFRSYFASSGDDAGSLVVDPSDLDFGRVWVTPNLERDVPLTNKGLADIRVRGFHASCGCVSIAPRSFVLSPGETVNVHVVMDLSPRGKQPDGTDADFAVQLVPILEDAAATVPSWTLKCRVRSAFRHTPTFAVFGEIIAGDEFPSRDIELMPYPGVKIEDIIVECPESTAVTRLKRLPGGRFVLSIQPVASLPVGPFSFPIDLRAKIAGGDITPVIRLQAAGSVVTDIKIVPSSLFVGQVPTGEALEKTIHILSRSGQPFSLESARSTSPHVSISARESGSPSSTHHTQLLKILIGPSMPGHGSAEVRLRARSPRDGNTCSLAIPVSWYAMGSENDSPLE